MKNRHKTVEFFCNALGYTVATEFEPKFDDGSVVKCFALTPPEKNTTELPWFIETLSAGIECESSKTQYHMAPEVFVSDGSPDSIVGKWVVARDGVGGIHHLAYQVDSVEETMKEWREKGYAEFTTEKPLTCPDLVQCFTKPSILTGVIYEFIERGKHGFCEDNVQKLMESTVDY